VQDPEAPPDVATAPASLEDLAAALLAVESELAATERQGKELRAELLRRVEARLAEATAAHPELHPLLLEDVLKPLRSVRTPGGLISYVPPSVAHPVDQKACLVRISELAKRLRDLGAADVDDSTPLGNVPRAASLRVTVRSSAEPA
jgi:hypothetical protein